MPFKCKLCDHEFDLDLTDTKGQKQLRNHYTNHHRTYSCRIRQYLPNKKENDESVSVLREREKIRKRILRSEAIGARNGVSISPRYCSYLRNGDKNNRCKVRLMSMLPIANLRCQHHPLKGVEFAKKHGIHTRLRCSHPPYLIVKPSLIAAAGNGVFTTGLGTYQKGDIITKLSGERMSKRQYNLHRHNPEYTVYCATLDKPYICGIDVVQLGKGYGSFINRGTSQFPANTEFVVKDAKTTGESVWVRAKRTIPPHSELLMSYGSSFRLK